MKLFEISFCYEKRNRSVIPYYYSLRSPSFSPSLLPLSFLTALLFLSPYSFALSLTPSLSISPCSLPHPISSHLYSLSSSLPAFHHSYRLLFIPAGSVQRLPLVSLSVCKLKGAVCSLAFETHSSDYLCAVVVCAI